jgi:hypothetical protein
MPMMIPARLMHDPHKDLMETMTRGNMSTGELENR